MSTLFINANNIAPTDILSIITDIIEYVLPSYFVLYIFFAVKKTNAIRKSIDTPIKLSAIS